MNLGICRSTTGLVALVLLAAACEPGDIFEARDQLGRGGERTIVFALPILDTVFQVETLLEDSDLDTLENGLLAVAIEPESVSVAVGDELEFTDIDFDQFVFGYDQMLQTTEATTSVAVPSPGMAGPVRAPAQGPGQIQFTTPDGSIVVGATVDEGWVVRTMQNGTNCDATVTVTLTDDNSATVAAFPTIQVAAGTTETDGTSVAGASVSGDVTLNTTADFGACVPNIGSSVATDVTFRPMTLQSVDLENVNETFTDSYDVFSDALGISAIDSVFVADGSFNVSIQNRLPTNLSIDVTLNGMRDAGGQPLSNSIVLGAASGTGDYTSGVLTFPLAGATIVPDEATAVVTGSAAAGSVTVTRTAVTEAVLVDGSGGVTVEAVSGQLDPTETPELTLSVEEIEEISEADLDFGDLEDAIDSSTINHANIALTLRNGTQVQAVFSDFNLGVVKLDATGSVPRDVLGDPVFEEDTGGNAIVVPVVDPGQTTLTLAASGTSSVDLDAAPLLDRLVDLLLDDERAAIVATGDVVVGDGTQARVNSTDSVNVELEMTLGLDFTIPTGGVSFTRNTTQSGLELDAEDADDLVERLDSAGVVTDAVNSTPFGVEVDIAFVEDSLNEDVDVFSYPGAVVIDQITLDAPAVDAQGRVTTPSSSTVSISLTGEQARQLAGNYITATVRARLLPGTGSGGRGAIRASDEISVRSQARIVLRSGGGGQ